MWFDNCQYPRWNILLLVQLMAILPGFSYNRYVMEVSAVPWHTFGLFPPTLIYLADAAFHQSLLAI